MTSEATSEATSTASRSNALATAAALLSAANSHDAPDQHEQFERLQELEATVLLGGPPASSLDEALTRIRYVRQREALGDHMYPEDWAALVDALERDLEHLTAT